MYLSRELFTTLTCVKLWQHWPLLCMTTLTRLASFMSAYCLPFACVVIALCLALMAAGKECFSPVCSEDNDKRPAWPCRGGSSSPPPERGHSSRLPLGSGVCQHPQIQHWSAPRRASQAQPRVAGSRERREQSFPWSFVYGALLQGPGLRWRSTKSSQVKINLFSSISHILLFNLLFKIYFCPYFKICL